MPEQVLFVPECHVDTGLTRELLGGRDSFFNHQHGISKVANLLRAQAAAARGPRFVVGMVDKDKRFANVTYLRQFSRVVAARSGPDCRYCIYQHEQHLTHYLIVLDPACDTWLFEAAHAAGLNLATFGLPPTLPAFIDFLKEEGIEDSDEVGRLLYAIKQAQPLAYRELARFVADVMDTSSRLWQQL